MFGKKVNGILNKLVYLLLPLLVFGFTSLPGINKLTPILALLALTLAVAMRWLPGNLKNLSTFMWVLFVLLLVGATGWFFSPFFFALYLAAIALGFIYSILVAISFTLALIVMFSFAVGEVNPAYDFMLLMSLLAVIPIVIALRRKYLLVQQEQKGILILEDENGGGITSLDSVMRNKVNYIGTQMRQPLTYIKQGLALLKESALTEEEYPVVLEKMLKAAEELFTLEKKFERDATRNTLWATGKGEKTDE